MVKTPLEFLSKKKWNPGNRNNREAVWIREQEKAAEEKKIKELQKKIKDERQLMEITAIHDRNIEDDKKECVEWMYTYKREGPTDEDYLTGKAAVDFDKDDKNTFSKLEDGSIAGASIANAPVVSSETEAFRRVHEDPLLEMKRKEIEMRKKLLENPRRKKQLMEALSKQLGKPVGISTSTADISKSSENDKHSKTSSSSKSNSERDHHHHSRDYRSKNHKKSSSSSSPSREDDDSDIDIDKKKENNTIEKRSEYRDNRVDSKRRHSRHRSNSNRRRSRSNSRHSRYRSRSNSRHNNRRRDYERSRYRSRSNSRHNNNNNNNRIDTYETRKIDDSHKNSNTYTKDRNNKKDKQLTEEEVQKRLNEMKQDASVNQDLRYKRLLENHKKDIKETEEEEELKKNYDENNNYLQSFKKDAYLGNDASLSDRIKSRTFYQQK
ncbi:hypothetical protein WA158_001608 [Blastocystis sp. Blastoise]